MPFDADLSNHKFVFRAVNDCIGPHVLNNGDWALYLPESGQEWELKKGDILKADIYVDMDSRQPESPGGQLIKRLYFGYVKDVAGEIDTLRLMRDWVGICEIDDQAETQVEFEIPEDGGYNFYIFCPASYEMIVQWVSIEME